MLEWSLGLCGLSRLLPQNEDSEWTCLHHQAGTHCPGLGDSSGSRGNSHSRWPGHCLHRAPGEDLTGALLCAPLPQAAARPHSCRGRGTRTVPGTSRSSPSPTPSPGRSRPHHFQPQQAPQEGSRCPRSTGHRECLHSAKRERAWAGVPLLRARSHPRGRTGAPPCLGPHMPWEPVSPLNHAGMHPGTHIPPGALGGVEAPASVERWTPNTACTSPIPTPCSQHQNAPQHRFPAAGWGSRPGW